MSNLLNVVRNRTKDLNKKQSSAFNTNDWMLENLVGKSIERREVIDMIIVARIEHTIGVSEFEKLDDKAKGAMIDKLYKTSKNGLDTSVSDSNNNSAFSYNKKYEGYKLVKSGSKIGIQKVK